MVVAANALVQGGGRLQAGCQACLEHLRLPLCNAPQDAHGSRGHLAASQKKAEI